MNVFRLNTNDAGILRELLRWSRPQEIVSLDRCKSILSNPKNLVIAALIDEKPVGISVGYVLQRFLRDVVFLYEIDVHIDYRRSGIGSQMIEHLKTWCRQKQLEEIFVLTNSSNAAAMRLYESTGGMRPDLDDVMFSYPTFN